MALSQRERERSLGAVELFASLDETALAALASRASEVEFPAGRPVARQGEIGTGMFLVLEGRVRVVRDGHSLASLGPGEFFGELSLLDHEPRVASVVTEEPTRCLAIASWDFQALLEEQPKVMLGLLRGVARRLRAAGASPSH